MDDVKRWWSKLSRASLQLQGKNSLSLPNLGPTWGLPGLPETGRDGAAMAGYWHLSGRGDYLYYCCSVLGPITRCATCDRVICAMGTGTRK